MPARRDFPIDAGYADGRLETFLRRKLGLPRTLALKALRKGWVRVGGHRARADARLELGSVVTITNAALVLPGVEGEREARPPVPARTVGLARASIRLREPGFLVSSKPAGEVVHAGSGHATGWVDALRAAVGSPEECVPVGRLDRDTSGLLVVATDRAASRALFASLKEGTLARAYTTLVLGRVARERGEIDAPLAKMQGEDDEQVKPSPDGKPALTRFQVVRRLSSATLLRITIDTGRTHQIRAHLASIGHPVLGDPRQGGTTGEALAVVRRAGLERLFLHAGELVFPDPASGERRELAEPLPPELANAVEQLA